jgi:hypothetical protein
MGLQGNERGTKKPISTDDLNDRKQAINALKEVFGWELEINYEEYKIDLLFKDDKPGGVDVEKGGWRGLYRDEYPVNYNKYTLPIPTANLPWRKEHFFNYYFEWVSNKGYHMKDTQKHFKNNSVIRFNSTYDEFFFVDYEIYQKIYKTGLINPVNFGLNANDRGKWMTDGIFGTDKYGNKVVEYWMTWELKDVIFYIKENGVWVRDRTLEDPEAYKELLDKYTRTKDQYKLIK